jgi:hypothetical protein
MTADTVVDQLTLQQLRDFLVELPARDIFPIFVEVCLVPRDPLRKAYTELRDIYLPRVEKLWSLMLEVAEKHEFPAGWSAEMKLALKSVHEVEIWLSPPEEVLTWASAIKLLKGTKSELFHDAVIKSVGKRRRPGQPKSKRHLAVFALDFKSAYPETTLRDVTNHLCPCGQKKHTAQCREQLRQQIKSLVKFLKQHGHDFTWSTIQ